MCPITVRGLMEIQEKAWVDKLERSGPYMAYGAGQVNAWTREPLSYELDLS